MRNLNSKLKPLGLTALIVGLFCFSAAIQTAGAQTTTQKPVSQRLTDAGYPRIMKIFSYDKTLTLNQISKYDLIVDGGLFNYLGREKMKTVRQMNPNFIGLMPLDAAYIYPTEEYNLNLNLPAQEYVYLHFVNDSCCNTNATTKCHNTATERVTFFNWTEQIYYLNFFNDAAVTDRINKAKEYIARTFNNVPEYYDGVYIDGVIPDFKEVMGIYQNCDCQYDINYDGKADTITDADLLRWQNNMTRYLTALRQAFPDRIIIGNDDVLHNMYTEYGPYLSGFDSEIRMTEIQNNCYYMNLDYKEDLVNPLTKWMEQQGLPRMSMLISYSTCASNDTMPTDAEKTALMKDTKEMRFALATSILTGTYFHRGFNSGFDLGRNYYWFDEYDNAGKMKPGYLGKPISSITTIGQIDSNMIKNGDFESTSLSPWMEEDHNNYGTISLDSSVKYAGNKSVKVNVTKPGQSYNFQLEQTGVTIKDGEKYILSFYAKAAAPTSINVVITKHTSDWSYLTRDFNIPLTTEWKQYKVNMVGNIPDGIAATLTPDDTRFTFFIGDKIQTFWMDNISLQHDDATVLRRDFENGIVLANASGQTKTIPLGKTYYRLVGTQDSAFNNGQAVSSVTLNSKDAIILLNTPAKKYAIDKDGDGYAYGPASNSIYWFFSAPNTNYKLVSTLKGFNDPNDNTAAIYPGCTLTVYRDADGDKYGNAALSKVITYDPAKGLGIPAGYVNSKADCNDSNSAIYPGATEKAGDYIDSDCDKYETINVYYDNDKDKYGNPAKSLLHKFLLAYYQKYKLYNPALPAGYILTAKDCNDNNAAIYPGVYDKPGDGIDMNCDGIK